LNYRGTAADSKPPEAQSPAALALLRSPAISRPLSR